MRQCGVARAEQPTKFDLVLNLNTAKELGLTVPQIHPSARRRGDRIKRRDFLALSASGAALWPLGVRAQEPGRTYRIGALQISSRDSHHIALYNTLSRGGFIEGRNLQIDGQGYGLLPEKFAEHAAELVKAEVDVILCGGAAAIRAAQQATRAIPIVGFTDDMLGEGLVRSLAHPGGNTTGVSILATELDEKRQELLIELIPGARRIAALADTRTTVPKKLQSLQGAASAKGVELVLQSVSTREEIVPAIEVAKASGVAGLNVLASPLLFGNRQMIFARTAALRFPAIYQWQEMAREGGLIGYGPSIVKIYADQVAQLLIQVLRGTRPADLPIRQPTNFGLVVNLKTAKALGLAVPPSILARADEVIE
jgi:putative ABC transport system substrate-binding protein